MTINKPIILDNMSPSLKKATLADSVDWPIDNFPKLSKMLIEKGIKVILLGTQHSKDKVGKFPKDKGIVSLVAETNLSQLISLIKRLDILVSGDSAPMHIGSAVGVKTIALFGPTDPIKHTPPGGRVIALVKRIKCQPCYKRSCINKEKLDCLNKISIDEVFDLILKKVK
ncbi:glycosyltransferase family 9 protein [Candidatus Omnitrophota bacterium]